jgi:hypothetical protein
MLSWEHGHPSTVLIVKKPGDLAAAAKMEEIGAW